MTTEPTTEEREVTSERMSTLSNDEFYALRDEVARAYEAAFEEASVGAPSGMNESEWNAWVSRKLAS